MPPENYAETSIARAIRTRLERTHLRQGIAILAGAPGIGKTTAIDAFAAEHPHQVGVIKIEKRNATERLVMQHVVEAVRAVTGYNVHGYTYLESFQVRQQLRRELENWHSLRWIEDEPRLTLIFDEAQNLSRAAIEGLRFWNDRDRCYAPFPIGLAFVGNAEFSLKVGESGQSTISGAVASRAMYRVELDRDELTDQDFALVMEAHGIADRDAVSAILRCCRADNAARDLRGLVRLIEEITDEANGAPVTLETVRSVLIPA